MNPTTITIPAATASGSGIKNSSSPGQYFLLSATSGPVRIVTNLGVEYDFTDAGSRFQSKTPWKSLTFYNDTGAPITVTFYSSKDPATLPDAAISSTINVTQAPVSNTLAGCVLEVEGHFLATPGVAGAAKAFVAASTYFRRATIIAMQSEDGDGAVNGAAVYIGNSATHQQIKLNPGDVWTIEADTGGKRDFLSWYIRGANNNDGVAILYV